MRLGVTFAAVFVGGLILMACAGGGAPARSRTPSPEPAAASCAAIADIASYRYTIRIKFQSPAFQDDTSGGDLLGQINQLLTRLFQNAELEGAYVAPDKSTVVLRAEEQELEVRTIGQRSWLRIGTLWQEQSAPEGTVILSPRSICDNVAKGLASSLEGIKPRDETVNGVESRRYHLDEADLKDVATLFPASEGQVPQRFSGDIWLAKEGNWPVRLQLMATSSDEQGEPVSLEMFMEFRDINSPDIEIEPPPVPLPQA